jgi:hypothetical protein
MDEFIQVLQQLRSDISALDTVFSQKAEVALEYCCDFAASYEFFSLMLSKENAVGKLWLDCVQKLKN